MSDDNAVSCVIDPRPFTPVPDGVIIQAAGSSNLAKSEEEYDGPTERSKNRVNPDLNMKVRLEMIV